MMTPKIVSGVAEWDIMLDETRVQASVVLQSGTARPYRASKGVCPQGLADYLVLNDIKASPRGTRKGRRLMWYLCQQADRAGMWIYLTVDANDPETMPKLVRYYEEFGFVRFPVNDANPHMWRTPSPGGRREERAACWLDKLEVFGEE